MLSAILEAAAFHGNLMLYELLCYCLDVSLPCGISAEFPQQVRAQPPKLGEKLLPKTS
jgi:hypothetical protein